MMEGAQKHETQTQAKCVSHQNMFRRWYLWPTAITIGLTRLYLDGDVGVIESLEGTTRIVDITSSKSSISSSDIPSS
jgi:hypothetical protein